MLFNNLNNTGQRGYLNSRWSFKHLNYFTIFFHDTVLGNFIRVIIHGWKLFYHKRLLYQNPSFNLNSSCHQCRGSIGCWDVFRYNLLYKNLNDTSIRVRRGFMSKC
ncbi:unnamed protein product [Merluccius merluccius]